MKLFEGIVNWIMYYRFEIEAVILILLALLIICLIVKTLVGRSKESKTLDGIDQKLSDIQSTVTSIKEEQIRASSRSPVNIHTEDGEMTIRVKSLRTEGGELPEAEKSSPAEQEPEQNPEPEAAAEPEPAGQEPEPERSPEPETATEAPQAAEPITAVSAEPEMPKALEPEAEPEMQAALEPEAEPEIQAAVEPETEPEEAPVEKLVEVGLDFDSEEGIDLSFEKGVEPVVNICSDSIADLEPGEYEFSLPEGESKEFTLAEGDELKVLVPEHEAPEEPEAPEKTAAEAEPEALAAPAETEPEPETMKPEPETAAEPEPEKAAWTVPGWRELSETLDMEFEPIHTIELAFDAPAGSRDALEEAIKDTEETVGRRSTDAVREAFEAASRRSRRDNMDDSYRVVRGFATDKHGNTYTEETLINQIN